MSNLKVYTYIPNLIGNHYLVYHSSVGYFRITNLLLLCITARNYPFLTALLYSLAAFGDLFDGMAARKFN